MLRLGLCWRAGRHCSAGALPRNRARLCGKLLGRILFCNLEGALTCLLARAVYHRLSSQACSRCQMCRQTSLDVRAIGRTVRWASGQSGAPLSARPQFCSDSVLFMSLYFGLCCAYLREFALEAAPLPLLATSVASHARGLCLRLPGRASSRCICESHANRAR